MTGTEYANLIAEYVVRRFGSRGLVVYREVSVGKSIIGKNRRIDILVVAPTQGAALAVECKFQDSQGTVDEKIPYALQDMKAMPMPGVIVWAGAGFSLGVRHLLEAADNAAYCLPAPGQASETPETRELDHQMAMRFGWWDVIVAGRKAVSL
jgi:hypothetical protein